MLLNVITLTILGVIDYKTYKIPNVVLIGWVMTTLFVIQLGAIPIKTQSIVLCGITAGMYFPLRRIVACYAGDFKLFAAIMLAMDLHSALITIFVSMIISLIPLACGVRKVPLALMTLFGYTAFLIFTLIK
jgi:Flp pilus assembly protein protease CpaA